VNKTDNVLVSKAKGVSAPAPASVTGSERRVLRVWVVDDNAALSELFAQLLNRQPGIRCTRKFPSAEAILATLAEERPPDILLLDINLGGQSGLSAIRPIKKLAPSVKVLMLTMFSNSYYEAEACRAGATGFLLKSYELAEIVNLIQEAYRNPTSPRLFPNIAVRRDAGLDREEADNAASVKHFRLVQAIRRMYRAARGETSG
jgi:DNA-binding NarL/FixJ family response regulator